MKIHAQFGAKVRKKDLEKFQKSPNWDGKKFINLIETTMDVNIWNAPKLLRENFKNSKKKSPNSPIPILPFEASKFDTGDVKPKFVWYGHSVCLLQINGANILIDPMLGPDAAPIAPFKSKRFSEGSLEVIDSIPKIDLVLLTHDHYDHLDLESIKRLKAKVDKWFVALGVSRHLEKWGIPHEQITEFDWWDNILFEEIKITFTPSRHFSGRGALDRAKSLWGGWVFNSPGYNVYWSGDGGYGPHFKEIGEKLGPFDWGFMECGQYHQQWQAIHMLPEESILAAIDAGVAKATPVHWGGFSLAMHSWKEPIERFVEEANEKDMTVYTPQIGEIVNMDLENVQSSWWTEIK